MIELIRVSKTYHSKHGQSVDAIKEVSLSFPDVGLVSIVGKSGCGKTTLLNLIGTLDVPDSGKIIIHSNSGKSVNIVESSENELDALRNLYFGYVFQDYYLIEEWTVWQNLEIVLKQQKNNSCDESNTESKINEIIEYVGLEGCEQRMINELSGGQQQRVSIARALVKGPSVIVADEPTGNLDSETSKSIITLLRRIANSCLVIMVTHDSEVAEEYSDRIIRISDGRIVSDEKKSSEPPKCGPQVFEKSTISLPNRTLLSIAFASLSVKKWKLLISAIVLTIMFAALEILNVYNNSSLGKAMSSLMEKSGDEFLYTSIGSIIGGERYPLTQVETANSDDLKNTLREEFGSDACFPMIRDAMVFSKDKQSSSYGNIVIGGKVGSRYELVGRMPQNVNEVVISDCIEAELGLGFGESLDTSIIVLNREMVVCGVFCVGYSDYFESNTMMGVLESQRRNYDIMVGGRRVLVCKEYEKEFVEDDILRIGMGHPTSGKGIGSTVYKCDIGNIGAYEECEYTIVEGRLPRNDNEIMVTQNLANNLLIESEWMGETPVYRFEDIHNDECHGMFSGYVSIYDSVPIVDIVGVIEHEDSSAEVYVTDKIFRQLQTEYAKDCFYDALEVAVSEENRSEIAFDVLYAKGINIQTFASDKVSQYYNDKSQKYSVFSLEIQIVVILILLLQVLFFTFNAKDNHTRIGIMRAMGVKRRDIAKSMIFEGVVLAAVTILISLAALAIWFFWINSVVTADIGVSFYMINMKVMTVIIPVLMFIGGMVLAILCPIYIITGRKKPIEIIREF